VVTGKRQQAKRPFRLYPSRMTAGPLKQPFARPLDPAA
jgi:hypothetical protein